MPAAALGEPCADELGLMARRVVHDDMDIEVGRNVPLDLVEEFAEFPCAVARHAFPDDRSRLHIERSEQRRRAVGVRSRGCAARSDQAAMAAAVVCGPAPGSGSFHLR